MKRLFSLCLAGLLFLRAAAVPAAAATSADVVPVGSTLPETCYLFAYFVVTGETGLRYAYSADGLHFTDIAGGKSFLMPAIGGATPKILRDPCLLLGPDGVFRLVWTTDWAGKDIGYTSSKDLIHWGEQQLLPVMRQEPEAQNSWAPDITWDPAKQHYLIFWSTTILGTFPETELSNRRRERNHRVYSITTTDFEHYTPTRLHYDGGFNVIDAAMYQDGDQWLMFVKNESYAPKTEKNIRLVRGKSSDGPWEAASAPITGAYWAEGPSALKRDGWWYVYFDKHMENRYGLVRSRDLVNWEDLSGLLDMPKDARHGSVIAVPRAVVEGLLKE